MPFGGVTVVLGGDFRQTLHVVPKAGREGIVAASISKYYLLRECKVFTLLENVCVDKDVPPITVDGEVVNFKDWMLRLGNGVQQTYDLGDGIDSSWINIPKEVQVTYSGDPVKAIVDEIYRDLSKNHGSLEYLCDRAILTPLNEYVDKINREVLDRLPRKSRVYKSSDTICKGSSTNASDEVLYPPEYLNSLKFSDMEGLSQLGYGYQGNKFLVRFIRLWESCSFHTYYATMINCILLNANNEQHWAIALISERDRLLASVCEGFLYYITGFNIVAAQPSWKPIDTNITLVFGKNTKVLDYLFRSSIPRLRFRLCTWPTILSRANMNTVLIDVGGVIIDVGDIECQRNDIKRLNLTLLDMSLSTIQITLWREKSCLFQFDFKDYSSKNVVLTVTGLLVKNRTCRPRRIHLTSTQATTLYFNPKCEEVRNLGGYVKATYGDFIFQFRCNVTIIDILLRGSHYDGACLECKDSVLDEHVYCCVTCRRSFITPISSPSIILLIGDHAGETEFTLQPRELKQLTAYSREEVLRNRRIVHGTFTFPRSLRVIKGAQCTFEVVVTPSSYTNTTGNFEIEQVVKYTQMQAGNQFN
ncbi:hypothetical protein POM88_021503 [Heracleum sosnowskyi]|uniref:ATP-dependent DNA helicase n=1 Tax=Heracleum sosnowskyi TaxID=360622 RepID=A0AAD8IEM5_9APIA|nr:hypothetical protein POM88_021503 [Heracleum sosnowskyi]